METIRSERRHESSLKKQSATNAEGLKEGIGFRPMEVNVGSFGSNDAEEGMVIERNEVLMETK